MLRLGVPDRFVTHGTVAQLLAEIGLEAGQVAEAVMQRLAAAQETGELGHGGA